MCAVLGTWRIGGRKGCVGGLDSVSGGQSKIKTNISGEVNESSPFFLVMVEDKKKTA